MPGETKKRRKIPPAAPRNFLGLNLLLILVFFFASLGWRYFHPPVVIPAAVVEPGREAPRLWGMDTTTAKNLLQQGLPKLKKPVVSPKRGAAHE